MQINRKGFNLDIDNLLILYGYNNMAIKLYKRMTEDGYKISMMVDRRASKLMDEVTVKMVDIDNVVLEYEPDKYVVVVMLYNAVQHDKIAEMFNEKYGINKIIYVPMADINNDNYSNIMRNRYNDFINSEYNNLFDIPYFESRIRDCENCLNIENIGEYIEISINAELLFTEDNPETTKSELNSLDETD